MAKGKHEKESSYSEKTWKIIIWAAAILKLIDEIFNFVKNISD